MSELPTVPARVVAKPITKPLPPIGAPVLSQWSLRVLLTVPVTVALALLFHVSVSSREMPNETRLYTNFLLIVLGFFATASVAQMGWSGLRRWLHQMGPIFAAVVIFLGCWEAVTTWQRWLPLPYFPSPAGVLNNLVNDRAVIWDSTWHSLLLLLQGYALGVVVGLISGICIGWFPTARYWGMPVLKVLGPIPATAWIPLALIICSYFGWSTSTAAATGLIAVAVWFPVTMLTASGISNTRASYLDVARTLGAGRAFLIFRVAIPAAMPSIFIGLFMGLGSSFLTLVVAESVGVKSGLGYYLTWAQGWAEYGKVFAALVIMAIFFSTIMTVLFKVRDRVLVWQKGVIKW